MTTARPTTARAFTLAGTLALLAATACGDAPAADATADAHAMHAPAGSPAAEPPAAHQDMDMGGDLRLTADQIRTFGITFGTAEDRPIRRTIRATGIIAFDETRMAWVAPKFGGWAERLHVDFAGAGVQRGEPLLDVYSPELINAQEELLLAARMADNLRESAVPGAGDDATALMDAALRRLRYWDIPDGHTHRVLETGTVARTFTLRSPAAGVVMVKEVIEGQSFGAGQNLYMIADLSEVWVNAEIFEADIGLVREGMPARVVVDALPGREIQGAIGYVYPTVGQATRSVKARVAVPNPGGALRPGMYATVHLEADLGRVLTLPRSAVLHTGERAIAFVDMGGGALMPHELTLGIRGDEYVQVIDGVEPGQRVVTSAHFLLDSESNLAEVMRAMMAQMDMSGMDDMEMDTDGGMDGMEMDTDGGMDGMEMPDTAGGQR